jgi:prolipoprotein diacylglyceryltransferase
LEIGESELNLCYMTAMTDAVWYRRRKISKKTSQLMRKVASNFNCICAFGLVVLCGRLSVMYARNMVDVCDV